MANFLTLQSVEEILLHIETCKQLQPESIALEASFGRTLAAAFISPEDLPGFDRSTMDGFAVRAKDTFGASEGQPAFLECIGECPMGEVPSLSIDVGQTAKIWTGGMLPTGADAVVMLEYSRDTSSSHVELTRSAAPGENVILHDEDAQKGTELLSAGTLLRAQELGLLAALGQKTIQVTKKPQVAIISSGDEVLPIHEIPKLGQVRDINSYTLAAFVTACGGEAHSLGLVGDDKDALRAKVAEALQFADVILLSGGSSAGQRDYTVQIFSEIEHATIVAHGVAISPGKPLILGKVGTATLWGLPGHAASALVCAEVFIRPLLERLLGLQKKDIFRYGRLQGILARPVHSAQGRRDYIRVALEAPQSLGGLPIARPIRGKSGLISTLVEAEAFVICPESEEGFDAGTIVDLYQLT